MPTFSDICYGFDGSIAHSSFPDDALTEVRGITLCSSSLNSTDTSAVYIGTPAAADYVLGLWDGLGTLNLLVAECSRAEDFNQIEMSGLNLVVTDMSLADVHNIIATNIADYEKWRERLLAIDVREGSVGELLATAVSIFDQQISLYLLSPTFHLIEYRSVAVSPENAIASMTNDGSFSDSQISFLVESSEEEKSTTYSTDPILEEGTLRGYLLSVRNEDTHVPKSFINLLTWLIPIHIRKSFPVLNERIQKLTNLFTDILLFDPNDVAPLHERLADLPYTLKPCIRMLLVTHDPNHQSTIGMIEDLSAIFPESNIAPYDRYIIVLTSGENFLFKPSFDEERLEQLLVKYDSHAIFTTAVRFIRGMRAFYKQAKDVLHIMESVDITDGSRWAFFEDLFEYERAHTSITAFKRSKSKTKLVYLFHPFVAELLRYDDMNDTDYISFAFAFAENNGSIAQTANLANYHRNTIYNKISRIREIFGVDLNDPAILRELIFSKKIMQIANAEGYSGDRFIYYSENRFPNER